MMETFAEAQERGDRERDETIRRGQEYRRRMESEAAETAHFDAIVAAVLPDRGIRLIFADASNTLGGQTDPWNGTITLWRAAWDKGLRDPHPIHRLEAFLLHELGHLLVDDRPSGMDHADEVNADALGAALVDEIAALLHSPQEDVLAALSFRAGLGKSIGIRVLRDGTRLRQWSSGAETIAWEGVDQP